MGLGFLRLHLSSGPVDKVASLLIAQVPLHASVQLPKQFTVFLDGKDQLAFIIISL